MVSRVDGIERQAVPWPDWAITTAIDTRSFWSTVWRAVCLAGSINEVGPPLLPILWKEVSTTIHEPRIWAAIEAVALALIQERELIGAEVADIIRHAIAMFDRPSPD